MNPATGSATLFGLGVEQEYGIPGLSGLTGYRARLPIKAGLLGTESPSGAVNQSGVIERGIPGPKSGPCEFQIPLRVGELLEFLEHLHGSVVKVQLEVGPPAVWKYTFEPVVTGVDTSFYSLFSTPPVEHSWLYGIKFSSADLDIGDNVEIPVSLKGFTGHGTRLGAAVPDVANTGTYILGPYLRGSLKDRAAGPVHVRVAALAPLTFKVQQTAGVPAFAGAAVPVLLDPETNRGTWQNLQGHTGLDLGFWDENKDPLEIVFPGEAADHGDLDVGDTFVFPVVWADPAVPFLTGFQRFTSAHWVLKLRAIGAGVWIPKRMNTGKLSLAKAVTPDRGNQSRYAFGMIRDGLYTPSIEANRKFVDSFFVDRGESQARLEAQLAFEGRQLGTGQFRESATFTFASARIDSNDHDPANEKAIEEKIKLTGETNEAGDPPVVVEVITARDWTPTA